MRKHLLLIAAAAALCAGPALAQGPGGLKIADANGDGSITRAEFEAMEQAMFSRIDANKDGFATAEEFTAHREAMKAQARQGREGRGRGGPGDPLQLDADKDGKVSAAEFAARPKPGFERLDANADGVISPEEMPHRGARKPPKPE